MAIQGRFTVPQGKGSGSSYGDRTFTWVVDSWVKKDEHTPESRPLHYTQESTSDKEPKEKLDPSNIDTISEMYIRVEQGNREPEYRFIAGPFFSVSEIDNFLKEAYEYESPK